MYRLLLLYPVAELRIGINPICTKASRTSDEFDLLTCSQLERYYDLSYTVVSLIFLSPFVGYTLASIANNLMHVRFGQRGVAIVGPACHLVSYIVLAAHPPYPVLVVIFMFVGFGNGLLDAAWCAWIGNMASANQVSGFLQGCYSGGATIAPLIATAMVTKAGLQWYAFYYIMVRRIIQLGPLHQKFDDISRLLVQQ